MKTNCKNDETGNLQPNVVVVAVHHPTSSPPVLGPEALLFYRESFTAARKLRLSRVVQQIVTPAQAGHQVFEGFLEAGFRGHRDPLNVGVR
ncbi:MAG: hypothetical protein ACREUD_06110 [Gammaproteobacteria bacterium]